MKRFLIFLVLGFCINSVISGQYKQATAEVQAEMVRRITSSSESMKSLRCDFTQRKMISILSEEMVSQGKMWYKYNDKLQWEYLKPYRYRFIMNGDKVMIDSEGRKNVIDVNQSKVFRQISRIIISGINGSGIFDDKKFAIKYMDSPKSYQVVLTPLQKEVKGMFSTITLTFSKSDCTVDIVEMEEKGGDRTVIRMTNKQINIAISDEVFALN